METAKKKFNFFVWLLDKREITIFLLIMIMCTILSLTTPTFLQMTNILNIFKQTSIGVVLACGITFIISSGGIDLSMANNMCLTSVVLCLVYNFLSKPEDSLGLPPAVGSIIAIVVAIILGAFTGLVNGSCVMKLGLPPFIVTMGVSNILLGLGQVVTKGYPIQFSTKSWMFIVGQQTSFNLIPNLIWFIPSVCLIAHVLLRKTVLGNRLLACGGNMTAARLSGLPVMKLKIGAYVIGGCFAGVAGLMCAGRLNAGNPTAAGTLGMDAICASVIGGTSMAGGGGSPFGAMLGAFLMQLIKNALIQYEVNIYWQTTVIGSMLIAICALDTIARKVGEANA